MFYVGIDVHKASCYLTIINSEGDVVRQEQIPTSRQAFSAALGDYEEPLSACLEAGYGWGKVYDWLTELCEDVVLAHPARVRLIGESMIKTDKIDSTILAHLLRAGLIPPAYASSAEQRSVKRVLRQRMYLVRMRTMVKNRVHSLVNQHSLDKPKVSDLFGVRGRRWLGSLSLPEPDGSILALDLSLLEQFDGHVSRTDELIGSLAEGDDAVRWLRSIPGIGPYFSVLIRHEIGDIGRFASAAKLASYTGLIPSTYASGQRVRHGRLTRAGNRFLRYAFVEAVTPAVISSAWLKLYYESIKERLGAKPARIASARKLVKLVWCVWTEGRDFEAA